MKGSNGMDLIPTTSPSNFAKRIQNISDLRRFLLILPTISFSSNRSREKRLVYDDHNWYNRRKSDTKQSAKLKNMETNFMFLPFPYAFSSS